jgi:hypothetical protein
MFRPGERVYHPQHGLGEIIHYKDRKTVAVSFGRGKIQYCDELELPRFLPPAFDQISADSALNRMTDEFIEFLQTQFEWDVGEHFPDHRPQCSDYLTIQKVVFGKSLISDQTETRKSLDKIAAYLIEGDFSKSIEVPLRTICEHCRKKLVAIFDGKVFRVEEKCTEERVATVYRLNVPSGELAFGANLWQGCPVWESKYFSILGDTFSDLGRERACRALESMGFFLETPRDFRSEILQDDQGQIVLGQWIQEPGGKYEWSTQPVFPEGHTLLKKIDIEYYFCCADKAHAKRVAEITNTNLDEVFDDDNVVLQVEPGMYEISYYNNLNANYYYDSDSDEEQIQRYHMRIKRVGDAESFDHIYEALQPISIHPSQGIRLMQRRYPNSWDPTNICEALVTESKSLPLYWHSALLPPHIQKEVLESPVEAWIPGCCHVHLEPKQWKLDDLKYFKETDFTPDGNTSYLEAIFVMFQTAISGGVVRNKDVRDTSPRGGVVDHEKMKSIARCYWVLAQRYPEVVKQFTDFQEWMQDTDQVNRWLNNFPRSFSRAGDDQFLNLMKREAEYAKKHCPNLYEFTSSDRLTTESGQRTLTQLTELLTNTQGSS